jgi:hypothetical protein
MDPLGAPKGCTEAWQKGNKFWCQTPLVVVLPLFQLGLVDLLPLRIAFTHVGKHFRHHVDDEHRQ